MQFKLKTWDQFLETRKRGRSLPETGYEYRTVVIYRAAEPSDTKLQGNNEYVTRSLKFAKEHADHQAAVHEDPFVVARYQVRSEYVFEAYNPGEYFYGGVPVDGKVIYTTN